MWMGGPVAHLRGGSAGRLRRRCRLVTVTTAHMQGRLHAVHNATGTSTDGSTATGAVLVRAGFTRIILLFLGVRTFASAEHVENRRPAIWTSNAYKDKTQILVDTPKTPNPTLTHHARWIGSARDLHRRSVSVPTNRTDLR